MKLLIAEDDVTSRRILEVVTRKWGYEPIGVEDGEMAWEVLQGGDAPRLLLLDWVMPRLDGLELCKRVREQEENNPPYIILLTARSEKEDVVTCLDAGANDYISKPFDHSELRARLNVGCRMLELQLDLNRTREELAYQATHDSLTGVLNRGAVLEVLQQEMARSQRQGSVLCVGMCDIDYFKVVNDQFGHLAGDAVLKEVADRFTSLLRPYDQVGRFGGEEFLILLATEKEMAESMFSRICSAIADKPFMFDQKAIGVTVSCGVVQYNPLGDERDQTGLLAAADEALYQAKAAGRNCIVLLD